MARCFDEFVMGHVPSLQNSLELQVEVFEWIPASSTNDVGLSNAGFHVMCIFLVLLAAEPAGSGPQSEGTLSSLGSGSASSMCPPKFRELWPYSKAAGMPA